MTTRIAWADEVWNPVTGCTPVSEGCANCYAKRIATRLAGRYGYPADEPFRVTEHPDRLHEPCSKWQKPRRIFVCSMGDLFHPAVTLQFQRRVFAEMQSCPWHTFLVLTKRPEWAVRLPFSGGVDRPNVWYGATVENQARADERIPELLRLPSPVRFVSVEPMLGPVDLHRYLRHWCDHCQMWHTSMECWVQEPPRSVVSSRVDWVIIGCESGPNRRPMKAQWASDLVRQCRAGGVPVFVKQLDIGGKVSHEPTEWPEDLRVREFPA